MAGISFRYDVQDAAVQRRFEGLLARAGDLTPAMEEAGDYQVSATIQRFEDGRTPQGTPLIPSQRAIDEHGQTLVDKGHYRDSETYAAGRTWFEQGSNIIYAAIHQLGDKAGRSHAVQLPARPVHGLSDDDENAILDIIDDHLRGLD